MDNKGTQEAWLPTVSVVICTAGRIRHLPRAIDSIREQTYRPVEIVLVVGPGTDATEQYAASLRDVKVRKVDRLNLSHARNVGIRAAAGEIIAFIDDDAVPAPKWLEEMVRLYQNEGPDCGGAGGAVLNENARSRPLQFRHGLVNELGEIDDIRLEPGTANAPQGPWFNRLMGTNMTFRRSALLAIGGFDEVFEYQHDETDVCIALIRAGYRIVHHGRAVVHHFPARSHNRRNDYELNWYALLKNTTYFALKHSQHSTASCIRSVVRRYRRLLKVYALWTLKMEITPWAGLRFTRDWMRGLWKGIALGRKRRQLGAAPTPMMETAPPEFFPVPPHPRPRVVPQPRRLRSLNVGLVCGEFGTPNMGGIGMYTQYLAESLASLGHTVTVFRSGWTKCSIQPRGYHVADVALSLIQSSSYQTALQETLYRLSVERPFDIIEAPLWAGEACGVGIAARCPLIVRLETPFEVVRHLSRLPLDQGAVDMIRAERLELSHAAGVIAISKAICQTVEEVYEVKLENHARRATVIPLGLPGADAIAVEPIPLPDGDGPRFLYVGRLESRKGIIELGEAFAVVARNLPTATLWMAGSDNSVHDGFSQRMGSSYGDWLRKLWGPDIAGRVHFFGHVTEAAKNFLYAQCDVFVAPSRYESFGLILLEAMRCNKPVIATNVGGIPEIVTDGETGLLVPVESSERLAAAMTTLGADAVMREQLGEASRVRFDDHFSLYRCGVRTEQFYREVLAAWDGDNHYELTRSTSCTSPVSARAA